MNDKIFVYGILRCGGQSAILKDYIKFIRGHATIKEEKGSFVAGELLDINEVGLNYTDRVEGVASNYYHRFRTKVLADDNKEYECWVYQQVEDKVKE